MDYEQACDNIFSRLEVELELDKHKIEFKEFAKDKGWRDSYTGQEVLDLLGY